MTSSMSLMSLHLVQLSFQKFIVTVRIRVLDTKFGTPQAKRSINQLHQFTIEVINTYNLESQVALCVYDITSKNSFQVMKNWVEELKSKGPEGLSTKFDYFSISSSRQQNR